MFQVGVIASGSKGNSLVVRTGRGALLLDAGLTGKKILLGLEELGVLEGEIKAVVVSHEHSDHIKGAGIISRKLEIPLYISEGTYAASAHKLGKLQSGVEFFLPGKSFEIEDIEVIPFASSHDAIESSNFVFRQAGNREGKLGVATDCGYFSRLMKERLTSCSTLVLESNHDEKMLLEGPYPWELKQRVKGRTGHLSNTQAVSVVSQIIHPGLKQLVLAHLSEENNCPQIARDCMQSYLEMIQHDLDLYVASQHSIIELLDI